MYIYKGYSLRSKPALARLRKWPHTCTLHTTVIQVWKLRDGDKALSNRMILVDLSAAKRFN